MNNKLESLFIGINHQMSEDRAYICEAKRHGPHSLMHHVG
jgi:hypothetical protein